MNTVKKITIPRPEAFRLPAKAGAWYIVSGVLSRGIGVFGTPIFTRLLTPDEYGLFPLYNTWLSLFGVFATLELAGGVIHRGMQKYVGRESDFMKSALALIFIVFSSFCTLYFTFSERINTLTGLGTRVTVLLLWQVFLGTLGTLYTSRCRYLYKYRTVAAFNILSSLAAPIISVAVIALTPIRAEARIVGSVATAALGAAAALLLMSREGGRVRGDMCRFLLRFNLPLLPHYLASSLILRIGEISVGRAYGRAALGKYSVAMSVGLSLTMITNGISSALGPWLLRKIKAGRFSEISSLLLIITRALALCAALAMCVAPEALALITTAEYRDTLPAIYPLLLTTIPIFLSGAFTSGAMYYEKNAASSLYGVMAALIATALSLILLPYFHYTAAGIFALVAYLALAALGAVGFRRLSGVYPISPPRALSVISLSLLLAALLYALRGIVISRLLFGLAFLLLLAGTAKKIYARIRE
ncbi:MAG: lipopolysaccharide biosynthesis protein [Clostridia bacterium]|nr:lipopolysaccharide biosynthesis protein [Clostridia bacterium]